MSQYKSVFTQIVMQNKDLHFDDLKDKIIFYLEDLYTRQLLADGVFRSTQELYMYLNLVGDKVWKKKTTSEDLIRLSEAEKSAMLTENRTQALITEYEKTKKIAEAETVEQLDGALHEYQKFLTDVGRIDLSEMALSLKRFLETKGLEKREAVDRMVQNLGENPKDPGLRAFMEELTGSPGSGETNESERPEGKSNVIKFRKK